MSNDTTTTPWKKNGRRYWRYLYGYLLVVERYQAKSLVTRWEATVDGAPAPARTDGLHARMSDAKAQAENYAERSCAGCRRQGFMHDLAGQPYTCTECGGEGWHRG